jgi:hypothetical protein
LRVLTRSVNCEENKCDYRGATTLNIAIKNRDSRHNGTQYCSAECRGAISGPKNYIHDT